MNTKRTVTPVITAVLAILICCEGRVLLGDAILGGDSWNDLSVRWSFIGPQEGFYRLPRIQKDAENNGYVAPPEEDSSQDNIQILCPNRDPTVCLLFDKQGNIAGMEIGVERALLNHTRFPYDKHFMFQPKTRFGFNLYVTTLFFVDQAVLDAGGRTAATVTGTGLWLKNGHNRNSLLQVPRLEVDMRQTANTTKGICVPAMGDHYYFNVADSTRCQDFLPIFSLYREGKLLGFGYQIFDRLKPLGKRVWFESIPTFQIKTNNPSVTTCLVNLTYQYGVASLHVYFVDNPYFISCLF